MRRIIILDKMLAARHRPRTNTTMIRIFGSNPMLNQTYPSLQHGDYFDNIFEYSFDDITLEQFSELDDREQKRVKLFSPSQAEAILNDFRNVLPVTEYLVVHCNAGFSRSPAVGAALNHAFDLGVPDISYLEPHMTPNKYVYSTLVDVAREKLGLRFKAFLLERYSKRHK